MGVYAALLVSLGLVAAVGTLLLSGASVSVPDPSAPAVLRQAPGMAGTVRADRDLEDALRTGLAFVPVAAQAHGETRVLDARRSTATLSLARSGTTVRLAVRAAASPLWLRAVSEAPASGEGAPAALAAFPVFASVRTGWALSYEVKDAGAVVPGFEAPMPGKTLVFVLESR